ncbi:MAG: lysylphosphatidylglycerol synthase transmembrane domain-containing protein [Thermoplasmata archaeon]
MDKSLNLKFLIISVVASLVIISVIFSHNFNKQTVYAFFHLDYFWLLIAILVHILYWILWTLRIKVLSKALNYKITLKQSFNVVLTNVLAASITPSNTGGEPVRIKVLNDYGVKPGDATAIVLMERLTDGIFLSSLFPILIMYFGFSIGGLVGYMLFITFALMFSGIMLFILLFYKKRDLSKFTNLLYKLIKIFIKDNNKRERYIKKIEKEIDNFQNSLEKYFKKKKIYIFITLTISGLMWISDFFVFSLVLLSLHTNPIWIYSIFAQIILVFITLLPISPGGSGIVEFSAALLYSPYVPSGILPMAILSWRFVIFYLNIIVGSVITFSYIAKGGKKNENKNMP